MKKFIPIILILVIVIIIIVILFKLKNNIEISKIKYFYFSQTNGYNYYSDRIYKLEYKDNKYYLSVKPQGVMEENAITFEVDNNIELKVEEIITKYHVELWNGFNKFNDMVLDGDSFSLNIEFMNNDRIDAHGYMIWPNNYKDFRSEIFSLFDELYDINNAI